jgi:hypothetical protein
VIVSQVVGHEYALPRIKEHLRMIKPIAKKYMTEDESESARGVKEERTPKRSR